MVGGLKEGTSSMLLHLLGLQIGKIRALPVMYKIYMSIGTVGPFHTQT